MKKILVILMLMVSAMCYGQDIESIFKSCGNLKNTEEILKWQRERQYWARCDASVEKFIVSLCERGYNHKTMTDDEIEKLDSIRRHVKHGETERYPFTYELWNMESHDFKWYLFLNKKSKMFLYDGCERIAELNGGKIIVPSSFYYRIGFDTTRGKYFTLKDGDVVNMCGTEIICDNNYFKKTKRNKKK